MEECQFHTKTMEINNFGVTLTKLGFYYDNIGERLPDNADSSITSMMSNISIEDK